MGTRNEIMLARYTQWANSVMHGVVAQLPEEAVVKPRDMTFGTLLRALGHGYAVGAIFKAHLEQRDHGFTTRHIPDTTTLDELRARQRDLDAWYLAWIERVSEAETNERVRFPFIDGGEGEMTRGEIFLHVINHYTFHRGFIVEALRGLGISVPATDITVYIRDCARK
ncbi:MAG TPA: DinB family protein [Paraburkholderia sp.]|uniref:DinB family protein n=1 Tax=Paraburkholderia sp. TaxID=1926495 RepID=UPI002BDB65B1|nr:DinB family protein [Paraburkholderia sp.]HTR08180.1 DinB family protein [Paraburkholderia sp.]